MEELHNAIADARYMGERNNDELEPLKPINWPSQQEIDDYKAHILDEDSSAFSFLEVTSTPAGVYLFTKFAKKWGKKQAKNGKKTFRKTEEILKFLDEVEEFRSLKSKPAKVRMAMEIWNHFLATSNERMEHRSLKLNKRPSALKKRAASKQDGHASGNTKGVMLPDEQSHTRSDGSDAVARQHVLEHEMDEYQLKKKRGSVLYNNVLYPGGSGSVVYGEKRSSKRGSCFVREDAIETEGTGDPLSAVEAIRAQHSKRESDIRTTEVAENGIGFGGPVIERVHEILSMEARSLGFAMSAPGVEPDESSLSQDEIKSYKRVNTLFDAVCDVCIHSFKEAENEFTKSEEFKKYLQILCMDKHVTEDNFVSFRILGKGGFGEVYAQKRVETGKLYAVKAMGKTRVKSKGSEDLCWNERDSLAEMSSAFVVSLKYAFQNKDTLYLVLDLMGGGDICYHLNKCKASRFPHAQARFHAAEILLGLEHIHSLGFVYRDLKPENVLLGHDGHAKISDLGLAVRVRPDLVGTAGTLGYMAPEMFRKDSQGRYNPKGKRKPYGVGVDWWAYGCMIMEMITGKCPFRTTRAKEFYRVEFGVDPPGGNSDSYRAATCRMEVDYSSSTLQGEEGERCVDLCKGLLCRDVSQRLGCSETLMLDLKYHPWFQSINWGLLASHGITPPYLPDKNDLNADDIQNIGEHESMKKDIKLTESDKKQWEMWDFVSETAFQAEMVEYLQWEETHGPFKNPQTGFCSVL